MPWTYTGDGLHRLLSLRVEYAMIVGESTYFTLQRASKLSRHTDNCICKSTVDFETFSRVLNRPGGFRDPGEPDEYCRGFQVFDKDMTGFIGVGQLKYILTNLGEKMTDEEVDELLKAVDTSSGQVNYTELVRTILAN